jgi:radical SAM protein with 4Fe4S-binding SPASM domain
MLEQWHTIIAKLKRLGVRRLNFSGGENFLYYRFAELVAYAKLEGFEIIINTNGTFSCKAIAGMVDEIIFSIHGLGQTHDYITDVPGAFERVSQHIREVASLVRVSVNTVLIRRNYFQMNDVFDLFDGACGLHKFSPTISIKSLFGFKHDKQALEITPELLADYRVRLSRIPPRKLELKHGFQSIYFDDPALYVKPAFPLPNCAGGKYKLVVDHDGAVYPCNFFKGPEFHCGNILNEDEWEIWRNGKGFNLFREMVLQEAIPHKCQGCLKKPRCFSGCRAWAMQYEKGGFQNAADVRCEPGNAFTRG